MQGRQITFLPGGVQEVTLLMLEPIDVGHFDRKDDVPPEIINRFNRQATNWSAHALLEQSCFILMAALDNLVSELMINTAFVSNGKKKMRLMLKLSITTKAYRSHYE